MEGIAGMIGGLDRGLVEKMLRRIHHRGPGSSAFYSDDKVVLGARCPGNHRGPALAVADGVAAASDSYLFNKEFLRSTIVPGAESDISDAGLFLGMYRAIGTRMFDYIDGAYAAVIIDHGKTILARDPYGLKPLYISTGSGPVVYSSEMKSQMLTGGKFVPFPPEAYLVSGERPRRIVLREIPWANGHVPKVPEERLRTYLTTSVDNCLSGASEANILLSGGIDSSVIAAVAAENAKSISTACVGTSESEDLRMARKVAEYLGTNHRERVFGKEEMLRILDDVIYAVESFDYPLIRSCIPNMMAVGLFKDKRSFTLCGEGGDELFAGYEFLRTMKSEAALRKARVNLLYNSHRTGFQRVDRITSSASLDCRMPMMSGEMVSFGLGLGLKELFGPKRAHAKYVLRKAFEKALPTDVIWRRKQKFSEGAGSAHIMAAEAQRIVSDHRFEARAKLLGGKDVRTKEEMWYYQIFREKFPNASALSSVGFTREL